jgi:hypothetical protein
MPAADRFGAVTLPPITLRHCLMSCVTHVNRLMITIRGGTVATFSTSNCDYAVAWRGPESGRALQSIPVLSLPLPLTIAIFNGSGPCWGSRLRGSTHGRGH